MARFAELQGLTFARLGSLVVADETPPGAPVAVHASPDFLARWRTAHGADAAASIPGVSGDGFGVRWIAQPMTAGSVTTETGEALDEVRFAIDSEVGFVCLHVGAAEPAPIGDWVRRLGDCLDALAEAVTAGVAIARAEEEVILRVLGTVGAAGAIVDAGGRARFRVPRGRPFDPRFIQILTGRDGMPERRGRRTRGGRDRAALDRFHLLDDDEGRRWVGYSIDLPIGETAFVSGDRLLVAWPLRTDHMPLVAIVGEGVDLARDLGEAFGLSGAESALAAALAEGDLKQAAARCRIGYETARSHLKSIFRRIGLTRQSELTALLARFAFHANLRHGLTATETVRGTSFG